NDAGMLAGELLQHHVAQLEKLGVLLRRHVGRARRAGEERHLAEEGPFVEVGEEDVLAVLELLPDPYPAFHDDEEAASRLALTEDLLARGEPPVRKLVHERHEGGTREVVEEGDLGGDLAGFGKVADRALLFDPDGIGLLLAGGNGDELDLLLALGAEQLRDARAPRGRGQGRWSHD